MLGWVFQEATATFVHVKYCESDPTTTWPLRRTFSGSLSHRHTLKTITTTIIWISEKVLKKNHNLESQWQSDYFVNKIYTYTLYLTLTLNLQWKLFLFWSFIYFEFLFSNIVHLIHLCIFTHLIFSILFKEQCFAITGIKTKRIRSWQFSSKCKTVTGESAWALPANHSYNSVPPVYRLSPHTDTYSRVTLCWQSMHQKHRGSQQSGLWSPH